MSFRIFFVLPGLLVVSFLTWSLAATTADARNKPCGPNTHNPHHQGCYEVQPNGSGILKKTVPQIDKQPKGSGALKVMNSTRGESVRNRPIPTHR
jgi:hypothetical protein